MVAKPKENSFDLLGKRWSALIVKDLMNGPRRFREILNDIGRINDKVLSQRLKELESEGIIERKVYAEVPVRVEYNLTERGKGLASVIHAMQDWDSGKMREAAPMAMAASEPTPIRHEPVMVPAAPVAAMAEMTAPLVAAQAESAPVTAAAPPAPEPTPIRQPAPAMEQPMHGHMEDKGQHHKSFWKRFGL
jgi:DNA-binding HxlR family transcriptional regulator